MRDSLMNPRALSREILVSRVYPHAAKSCLQTWIRNALPKQPCRGITRNRTRKVYLNHGQRESLLLALAAIFFYDRLGPVYPGRLRYAGYGQKTLLELVLSCDVRFLDHGFKRGVHGHRLFSTHSLVSKVQRGWDSLSKIVGHW